MANEQSPLQSTLDAPQVLQNTHHQAFGVLKTMSGFVAGAVGRKIERQVMSTTVDRFHFKQGSDTLMTYEVTYDNSDHDNVNLVERIA